MIHYAKTLAAALRRTKKLPARAFCVDRSHRFHARVCSRTPIPTATATAPQSRESGPRFIQNAKANASSLACVDLRDGIRDVRAVFTIRAIEGLRAPPKTQRSRLLVGCDSDGQVGPLKAPSGRSKVAPITIDAANRLAFYMSPARLRLRSCCKRRMSR